MSKIEHINARQILDSRGNPTVEVDVFLETGEMGRAAVPSGASTGSREAHELRDGGVEFQGKGVLNAVNNVFDEISSVVIGMDSSNQEKIDGAMVELDGTENKSRLGANAILAVSLAVAKAEADSVQRFFYEYVGELSRIKRSPLMPVPMCNVINGGKHAMNSTDIQEFMIIPISAQSFYDALRMSAEVFYSLKDVMIERGYRTTVGDEGGFAPNVKGGNEEAFEMLINAVEKAGYTLGKDIAFAIDSAANEFSDNENYTLKSEGKIFNTHELIDFYVSLIEKYPLISIEDPLSENDWSGWSIINERIGNEIQIVGDDLLVTNVKYIKKAIEEKAVNSVLIKVNQIGTLTETIDAVDTANENGLKTIISHRSGETEDTTISHLAVGLGTGQIKAGSLSRTDRVAKYNELLRIEEILGEEASFGGLF